MSVKSKLKIAQINAQSLRDKCNFSLILAFLAKHKIDILSVAEAWTTPNDPDSLISIPGYKLHRNDRGLLSNNQIREFMLGGGVACYVIDNLNSKLLLAPQIMSLNETEYLLLEIKLPENDPLLFASVYRRPDGQLLSEFFITIQRFIPNYSHLIISGDLNSSLSTDKYEAAHLTNLINENSLHLVPTGLSYHEQNIDKWHDVILIDDKNKLVSFEKSQAPFINGHDYIIAEYAINKFERKTKQVKFRDFKNCNFTSLENNIVHSTQELLQNTTEVIDVNLSLEKFKAKCRSALDLYAPFRTREIRTDPAPWLTTDLIKKRKERDKIYRQAKRLGNSELRRKEMERYKNVRSLVKKEFAIARDNYLKNKLSNADSKSQSWAILRSAGLLKQQATTATDFFSPDDLAKFYSSISRQHPPCSLATLQSIINSTQVESEFPQFSFKQFDLIEVNQALQKSLSNSKGLSPDGMPLKYFENFLLKLAPFFTAIFNASIKLNEYPDMWKLSYIIPLNKVKNPSNPSETRPIANLSHAAKAFDTLTTNQLVKHLESNNMLSPVQSGFRANYSTQSALLKITDVVREGIDNGLVTVLILFDFSKAFDSIDHAKFLMILKKLNFSNDTIRWFHSYLSNRRLSVINPPNAPSNEEPTDTGVPQGSVSGPIIFIIFINAIILILKFCQALLFADDFQMYLQAKPEELNEAIAKINLDAAELVKWAKAMGLTLNAGKTQAILLTSGQMHMRINKSNLTPIIVDNNIIPLSKKVKNLGVIISEDLTWNAHISSLSSKINGVLYKLRFRKSALSAPVRRMLVNSLVIPHFDYGCLVYNDLSGYLDLKLRRLLNSCIRFTYGVQRETPLNPFREYAGWFTPIVRRKYFLACAMYRILQTGTPCYLREYFVEIAETTIRRSPRDLSPRFILPARFNTDLYKNSFFVSAIYFWNQLPVEIIKAPSYNIFKKSLRDYLLNENNKNPQLFLPDNEIIRN